MNRKNLMLGALILMTCTVPCWSTEVEIKPSYGNKNVLGYFTDSACTMNDEHIASVMGLDILWLG